MSLLQDRKEIPGLLSSRGILVFMLLADIMNSIIREIIFLSDSESKRAGSAAMIVFISLTLIVFVVFSFFNMIYVLSKYGDGDDSLDFKIGRLKAEVPSCTKVCCTKFFVLTAEVAGVALFLYGDNVIYLLNRYGEPLGCDEQCFERHRAAAVITLSLTLIIYFFLPTCCLKIVGLCDIEMTGRAWFSSLDMITALLKIDALFTLVMTLDDSNFCTTSENTISITLLVILALIGIPLVFKSCIFPFLDFDKPWLILASFLILIFSIPVHLLTDNIQPLDCSFSCDSFTFNQTINDFDCDYVGNSVTRLTFSISNFIFVLTVSIMLLFAEKDVDDD